MPHLQSNGISVYYEEHGQENSNTEPLILIMGFTVSSIGWHWNVPSFAQSFRTIAFDNRGVGQTDKPDEPYTMQMFADDTAGLLDGLDIDQAHIFGISMGPELSRLHPVISISCFQDWTRPWANIQSLFPALVDPSCWGNPYTAGMSLISSRNEFLCHCREGSCPRTSP